MSIPAEDRAKLVALARAAVEAEIKDLPPPAADVSTGLLSERRGCFVTLTNRGRLRGCIGTFSPHGPLGQMVVEMGMAAACDPRFVYNPVTPTELPQLTIEVSVLSPLELTFQPEQLEIGKHGIYIIGGNRAGCFLPEVATDQGWAAEEFLDQCCEHKAGLPKGSWRKPGTNVYLFTSEKFDH